MIKKYILVVGIRIIYILVEKVIKLSNINSINKLILKS